MSDDFDEFDDDLTGLDFAELDQQVSTLLPPPSQQPRKPPPPAIPIKQKYHHTVAHPSKQPVARTSLPKDPGPINTEPRAAGPGSGFGWNVDGGKRSYDGNLDRHLGDEQRRNDKWRERQNQVEEEEFPEVVLRKEGGYGFGITETDVAANGMKGLVPPASQNTAGAAARRAAIISASRSNSIDIGNNAVAGPSRLPPQPQSFKQPLETSRPVNTAQAQFPPRALARSTSAGHQPQPPRPLSRNGISNLPTIHSQSQTPTNSQQPPASQGSLVRKTAIELAEEVRRREIAEEEIKVLKAEVERVRLEKANANARTAESLGRTVEDQGGDKGRDYARLQQELWAAQGEGKNIRRAQKELEARHATEAEKWRLKIEEMEARLVARDKEAARQVENIKSQAVFSNHAAHNSVLKMRQPNASQRPAATPHRGSPQGKTKPESLLQTITGKGKSKSIDKSIPAQPNFGNLNNAFAKTPTITTKIKRAKTELRDRDELASPPRNAFVKSKGKGKEREYAREETRSPGGDEVMDGTGGVDGMGGMDDGQGDVIMDDLNDGPGGGGDAAVQEAVQEEESGWGSEERDMRAEMLYVLTTHVPLSPLQAALQPDGTTRPTLYRLLHYQPPANIHDYARHCSNLLKSCGEDLPFDSTVNLIGSSCVGLLTAIIDALVSEIIDMSTIIALTNIFDLLSRLIWLFPDLANHLQGLSRHLATIVDSFFTPSEWKRLLDNFASGVGGLDPDAWGLEMAEYVGKLAEGLCWFTRGGGAWTGQELLDVTYGLLDTSLPVQMVKYGINVVWAASCNKNNFRALIANKNGLAKEQPLLERIGQLLIKPHVEASEKEVHGMTLTLIRAIGLLTIADRDAVILVAEQSIIVPALILVLHRESTRIWGIWSDGCDVKSSLEIIQPALSLLHHLIYPLPLPPPSIYQINPIITPTSKRQPAYTNPLQDPEPLPPHLSSASQLNITTSPQGINLPQVLQRLAQAGGGREWNGLGNIFVSCLGSLAYGAVGDELRSGDEWDLEVIQYLSQDILESVVEGPEGDAVYEIYAEDEEGLEVSAGSAAMTSGRRQSVDGGELVDETVLKDIRARDQDEGEGG